MLGYHLPEILGYSGLASLPWTYPMFKYTYNYLGKGREGGEYYDLSKENVSRIDNSVDNVKRVLANEFVEGPVEL